MDQTINLIFAQLQATLSDSIREALNTHRPLITHLNADTTWLLSIPYPPTAYNPLSRSYYHILIDPWLRGGQSDVAAFFSQQWHANPSAVQSIQEVEDVIKGIEEAANKKAVVGDESWIDVVVVSHEFTDHMHKDTLLEIPSTVPVFAASKAAAAIISWVHFDRVKEIPRFDGDWRGASLEYLPDWVGISRVAKAGVDLLYYHSAVMITFSISPEDKTLDEDAGEEMPEAVIYTPHGIDPGDLTLVGSARPPIRILALLHGLQDISLPRAQLNKGAHNGLKVQRLLNAKYWLGTHDEVKTGGGLVSWFLNRKVLTLEEALEREAIENGDTGDAEKVGDIRFLEVGNGESLILV
ncbi:4a9076f8-9a16-4c78-a8a9-465f846a8d69 [Sclerotinia trifoliorum]|uniref:4a9076f8-9a16-4c78-a8a9-465f846a8d69 n=1 Tax=Sclerotinia trifoliorum TaxID=28548 RepID=A0A8H2VP65_9HELO|nr:4a9076f8-9a16-4c78-a8a9-465f846a8d69 [Sclerotinia trifoliorum]